MRLLFFKVDALYDVMCVWTKWCACGRSDVRVVDVMCVWTKWCACGRSEVFKPSVIHKLAIVSEMFFLFRTKQTKVCWLNSIWDVAVQMSTTTIACKSQPISASVASRVEVVMKLNYWLIICLSQNCLKISSKCLMNLLTSSLVLHSVV